VAGTYRSFCFLCVFSALSAVSAVNLLPDLPQNKKTDIYSSTLMTSEPRRTSACSGLAITGLAG